MEIEKQWSNLKSAAFYLRDHYYPDLGKAHVHGEGNSDDPAVMLIGEAPGAQEATQGRPFVGKSGLVLHDLMDVAGLSLGSASAPEDHAGNAWLTNVVKFRPAGNRTPTEDEIRAFRRLLKTEWRLIGKPTVIVPIGSVALRAVIGRWASITRMSGKCQTVQGSEGPMHIWPMLHPAYGLRNPALRPVMERDWDRLGRWLNENLL